MSADFQATVMSAEEAADRARAVEVALRTEDNAALYAEVADAARLVSVLAESEDYLDELHKLYELRCAWENMRS